MKRVLWGIAVTCAVATGARAEEPAAGKAAAEQPAEKAAEIVLVERNIVTQALGKSYTRAYIVPATVASRADGKVTLRYEDGVEEARPEADAKAVDWKGGQKLYCRANGKPTSDFVDYKLVKVDGANVVLESLGDPRVFPLMLCRQDHPFGWWNSMSSYYKDFKKYKEVKAAPSAKRKDPPPGEIQHALDVHLRGADGGAYIQIKSCVPEAGDWKLLENAGSKSHTAREVPVACTVAIPLPPKPKEDFQCLVLHGTCRQNHKGLGKYTACQYSTAEREPERIACPKK